jgi:hypothetical protein
MATKVRVVPHDFCVLTQRQGSDKQVISPNPAVGV